MAQGVLNDNIKLVVGVLIDVPLTSWNTVIALGEILSKSGMAKGEQGGPFEVTNKEAKRETCLCVSTSSLLQLLMLTVTKEG